MIASLPFTGAFQANIKNYGSIKKHFCFLLFKVQFGWSLSKIVHTIVWHILMIWKVSSPQKILKCLVWSILVLICIYFLQFSCSSPIWVLGQFLSRFLINLSINFLINLMINFSLINFLMTTSSNCFWM